MIEVFAFNTTNGKVFEMRNTTLEEIKEELKKKYPNWSDAVIEKIATNQSYYKEVIPMKDFEKKKKQRSPHLKTILKEAICINGYELNPILNLGLNIHAYYKNGYRQWGVCVNKFFNHPNIAKRYSDFEKKYDEVVVEIKKYYASKNKQTISQKVFEMCDKMESLKAAIVKTGYLNEDTDKEYICGSKNGKRLGMLELVNRIGELCEDCSETLKQNLQ